MKRLILSLFLLFTLLPIQANAITTVADDTVMLMESIDDDVYSAGRKVITNASIGGDFIVAGQSLDVLFPIGDDLNGAGQFIDIEGDIGDDLRLAGQKITIDATIGDSVTVFGQDIFIKDGSSIKGDFWAFGESVIINGEIFGDVVIEADQVILNAPINGNAEIKAKKIKMGEKGKIIGSLNLKSWENVDTTKVGGEVTFTAFKKYENKFKEVKEVDKSIMKIIIGFIVGLAFMKYLGLLAVGALLIWLTKNYILGFVKTGKKDWLANTGIGFAVLILAPVLGVLLLISLIGIPFAGLVFLSYAALMIVAKIMIGFFVGHLMVPVNTKSSFGRMLGSFALGTFVFMLLTLIPVLGWIAQFIAFLITLGAISRLEWDFCKVLRKAKKV